MLITNMKQDIVFQSIKNKTYGLSCCGYPPGVAGMIFLILEWKREWLTWCIKCETSKKCSFRR